MAGRDRVSLQRDYVLALRRRSEQGEQNLAGLKSISSAQQLVRITHSVL